MADLVVIVPSRGRPHTVAEMAEAFEQTCTAETEVVFAVDSDDPHRVEYGDAARLAPFCMSAGIVDAPSTMVRALNECAAWAVEFLPTPRAIGFLGDDHRPRTVGWDRAYLDALAARPGIVYGNDLIQGANLPTQCAMSTSAVRALGHMAPPALTHLYVDNYWRDIGNAAGCLTYLPNVIVEHIHPVAGKAAMDDGYRRANSPQMYQQDGAAYAAYMAENRDRDVLALLTLVSAP